MENIETIKEVKTDKKGKLDGTNIQIPNSVIKNGSINDKAFLVYYYLKHESFRSYGDKINLQINHIKMKIKLCIKDNRTLTKALQDLYSVGLIADDIEKMPIHSLLKITLNEIEMIPFAQLPIGLFDKIAEVDSKGLRLLYYYESFINRLIMNKEYAFPSYNTIQKETGLSNATIKKYNDKLHKLKFVKVQEFKPFKNDDGTIHRFNNRYFVRLDKIK